MAGGAEETDGKAWKVKDKYFVMYRRYLGTGEWIVSCPHPMKQDTINSAEILVKQGYTAEAFVVEALLKVTAIPKFEEV